MYQMPGVADVVVRDVPQPWIDDVSRAVASTSPGSAVIVLPEFFERGVAVFPAYLVPVVKSLRADGVEASFLNGEQGKTFRSTFSAETTAVFIGIIINVLSNGIYDSIRFTFQLLQLRLSETLGSTAKDNATFRMAIPGNAEGTGPLWQEIIGPSDKVIAYARTVAERHLSMGGNSSSSGSSN